MTRAQYFHGEIRLSSVSFPANAHWHGDMLYFVYASGSINER